MLLARQRAQGVCKCAVKLFYEPEPVGKNLFCKELTPGIASLECDPSEMLLYQGPVILSTMSFDFNLLEECLSLGEDSKWYSRWMMGTAFQLGRNRGKM